MDLVLVEKALLGLFATVTLAIVVSKLCGKRFKLPSGLRPVPIVMNWLQVGNDLNHLVLTGMAKRFNDIFHLLMGMCNLVLVVSSPELAREVLHAQGVEFGSRTRNVVLDIFTGKGQDMVFTDKDVLIVCLYVDDLIFTGSNPSMFGEFKDVMTKEFEMTDIGLMAYYLGIEVNQREDGSFISQAGYAREILKKFRMNNSKSINTPVECGVKLSKHDEEEKVDPTFFKSLVGSLRYLTCTRPDILYAVGLTVPIFTNKPFEDSMHKNWTFDGPFVLVRGTGGAAGQRGVGRGDTTGGGGAEEQPKGSQYLAREWCSGDASS
ncbi:hypothetical protein ZIOFF_050354 [Zingiber officinale]|uniref:Reverse transcriptase Ty1/copia-type domain-containing protein n=1 Tax=Zingiber officinale TaxID=94328 RepID=A0A8J5FPT0_ZINOF|nr:hypothetical protein ZIOFF_050354 [Zingiber officinale]